MTRARLAAVKARMDATDIPALVAQIERMDAALRELVAALTAIECWDENTQLVGPVERARAARLQEK